MKKYLVTGGAGFIGSNLSRALLKKGNKVVVADNFSASSARTNNSGIKNYRIDADDANKIKEVFLKEKPDFVFHLAGAINLRRSEKDPLFQKDLKFLSRIKIILDACKNHKTKKIIFVSSGGAIYENATEIPTPETYPASPSSPYGKANLKIEECIKEYCKKGGLNFVIPRLSNVYGPGQWESGFIPSIILKILKKEPPIIYSNGTQTRDFVYIDDVVKALILLAESDKNGIYNVGTGIETSLNETFKLIRDFFDIGAVPIYESLDMPQAGRSALDIKKIKKELGWRPKISIKEGLIKTIEWYKSLKHV